MVDIVNLISAVDTVNLSMNYREMVTTRDALIDEATILLDAGGSAAVTLRDVGKRAGVSHNAPYKHFASKEALLAAIATRELSRPRLNLEENGPADSTRDIIRDYIRWALRFPARFKLVFGRWSIENAELRAVAHQARQRLLEAVEMDQRRGDLPAGDSERLASLLLATAHGAVDQALAGHLAVDGKGHASPADLVEDLFHHLGPK
jgi:AcrR family transcriptional regulator